MEDGGCCGDVLDEERMEEVREEEAEDAVPDDGLDSLSRCDCRCSG